MARYIDADKVMEEIARIGGHNLCEWETIGVKALIDRQPTADVAPRAEVEAEFEKRLAQYQDKEKCIYTYDGEIWDYCVQGPCPHHKTLEALRQEVAREIFEEIEKILNDERINRKLAERGFLFVRHGEPTFEQRFAELKNKYAEVQK